MAGENGRGPALVVDAVSKSFGAVKAVQEVGFDVERGPAYRRARGGLGTVFQVTRPPHDLDVLDSTMVGCHAWTRTGFLEGILKPPWQWREERLIRMEAGAALEEVGLAERAHDPAD